MQVTIKQLCDLISLSLLAVTAEEDGTVLNPNHQYYSPVAIEVGRILGGDQCSCEDAQTINDHLAAIRLGMSIHLAQ